MPPIPVIHCPYCGTANDYYAQVCKQCGQDIAQVLRPPLSEPAAVPVPAANTVKNSTIVLIVLAVVLFFLVPVIGGIACGVAAYFSYKSPNKNWPLQA